MESNIEFKVGDKVKLKSGGEVMTIDKFPWNSLTGEYEKTKVECIWFVGTEFKRETIQITSLIHA